MFTILKTKTIQNWFHRIQHIENKVGVFEHRSEKEDIARRLRDIEAVIVRQNQRIVKLETAAHGLKKDLTPRAKPGRKAKVQE